MGMKWSRVHESTQGREMLRMVMAGIINPNSRRSRSDVIEAGAVVASIGRWGGFGDDGEVGHCLSTVAMVIVIKGDDVVLGGPGGARRTAMALLTHARIVIIDHDRKWGAAWLRRLLTDRLRVSWRLLRHHTRRGRDRNRPRGHVMRRRIYTRLVVSIPYLSSMAWAPCIAWLRKTWIKLNNMRFDSLVKSPAKTCSLDMIGVFRTGYCMHERKAWVEWEIEGKRETHLLMQIL